jgi:lipoyl(octanoyl) transferase
VGSTPESLSASWLGRREFEPCLAAQLAAREAIVAGTGGPRLFLVEHPPTLTLGRRGRPEDVLWDPAQLAREGVAVCDTPRGGEVTLHAPGQLVAYPVVHVGRQIRAHIVRLAETTIEVVSTIGVLGAEFRMDHPGVWVGEAKLASIGVHISRGVAVQGLAMNVDVARALFGSLVSCGLPEVEMANLVDLAAKPVPSMELLARQWADVFARRMGLQMQWAADLP